jgi:hypothetical protein
MNPLAGSLTHTYGRAYDSRLVDALCLFDLELVDQSLLIQHPLLERGLV